MTRTRIKICGITRARDAVMSAHYGADAIGLVFYPQSTRAISIEQAITILRCLPIFVSRVGLFVNADPAWVKTVLKAVSLDWLQFHGDESPMECEQYQYPYIKAIRVTSSIHLASYAKQFRQASALLLDAYSPHAHGGTGLTFDWSLIPSSLSHRIILAGGLNADNVSSAILKARPYAVDVSSGVESRSGIKSLTKLRTFMRAVAQVSGDNL